MLTSLVPLWFFNDSDWAHDFVQLDCEHGLVKLKRKTMYFHTGLIVSYKAILVRSKRRSQIIKFDGATAEVNRRLDKNKCLCVDFISELDWKDLCGKMCLLIIWPHSRNGVATLTSPKDQSDHITLLWGGGCSLRMFLFHKYTILEEVNWYE